MPARSALDRRVDAVLEEVSDLLSATPRDLRAAVLAEVTAALVDTMICTSRDPAQAAALLRSWIAGGLAQVAAPPPPPDPPAPAPPAPDKIGEGAAAPRLH